MQIFTFFSHKPTYPRDYDLPIYIFTTEATFNDSHNDSFTQFAQK